MSGRRDGEEGSPQASMAHLDGLSLPLQLLDHSRKRLRVDSGLAKAHANRQRLHMQEGGTQVASRELGSVPRWKRTE